MVLVAALIRETTSEMAHATLVLPAPVITAITYFNNVHRVWRWFRLGAIYSNPDNFLKLAAGHGLNFLFGDSVLLRISAVCVLIATRILECVQQHFKLQKSWNNLVSAFHDHFPTPIKIEWEVRSTQRLLSASTVAWWKYKMEHLWNTIHRLAMCFFHLCKDAFILSMRVTDAIETFALSPTTKNEGINLLFVNGSMWVDKLVESKQMLIDGLTSNKKVIEKILNGIHSPLTCEQLIKTAKDALDTTEKFHQTAESVSNTFGIFITTCVKKWGYEFMSDLGLHHLIPKSLLPPAKPPWEIPKYKTITVHYPPLNLITKPSMLKQALKPNEIAASLKKILETDSSMLSSKGKTAEEIKSLVLIDKKDKKTKTHHKVINQWSLIK